MSFFCLLVRSSFFFFFFFNDTATTEIYTLSLHDALPIWLLCTVMVSLRSTVSVRSRWMTLVSSRSMVLRLSLRSEEHTSELQSRLHLVCRLLLEKKKKNQFNCKMIIYDDTCTTR